MVQPQLAVDITLYAFNASSQQVGKRRRSLPKSQTKHLEEVNMKDHQQFLLTWGWREREAAVAHLLDHSATHPSCHGPPLPFFTLLHSK